MFSTILKEVTGYFDKRALLSAFFPSLVFWGMTLLVVIPLSKGWKAAFDGWDAQSATIKGLLLLAFFVWIAFWSFLTLNLRPLLSRIYEGNWGWRFSKIEDWRRQYWQNRWTDENSFYKELSEQAIHLNRDINISLTSVLTKMLAALDEKYPLGQTEDDKSFDALLNEIESSLVQRRNVTPLNLQEVLNDNTAPLYLSFKNIAMYRKRAEEFWEKIKQRETNNDKNNPWVERRKQINRLVFSLRERYEDVEEQRQRIIRDFSIYFPQDIDNVMPTLMGNVLKAAEVLVWKRYHLNAVSIWPRLQSSLPKEFADALHDARMSLDMMLTLSTLIILFGTFHAVYLAFNLPAEILRLSPWLLIVVLPLLLKFIFRLRMRWVFAIAALALFLTLAVPFFFGTMTVTPGFDTFLATAGVALSRIEMILALMVGVWLLAWLVYHNGVQAAVAYAEKIQSSFDLYRWKVFEALNLQLPPSFEDEQRMWEQLSALFSTSKRPDPTYYKYVKQDKTKEQAIQLKTQPKVKLPMLKEAKPPYQLISGAEIIDEDCEEMAVPIDAARSKDEIQGKLSLEKVVARTPIRRSLLADPNALQDTFEIGIPVTHAASFGGKLQTGHIVDLLLIPLALSADGATEPVTFENLLVLDVKQTSADPPYIINLAIPLTRRTEFARLSVNATFMVTHNPMPSASAIPHDVVAVVEGDGAAPMS